MVAKPSVRSFQPQFMVDPSASALCPGQATGGKMVDQNGGLERTQFQTALPTPAPSWTG